jgi:hypothetical protein
MATLLMHLERTPPLEESEGVSIPPPLIPVLRRALAKEPRARYATAVDLAGALRAAHEAVVGARASPRSWARRALPKVPPRWLPRLLGLLALLGLGVVALVLRTSLPRGPSPPRTPAETATPAVLPGTPTPPGSMPANAGARTKPSGPEPTPLRVPAASPSPPLSPALSSAEAPPQPAPADMLGPARATEVPATPPPTPAPVPTGTPLPSPTPADTRGGLLVVVDPWASVSVDGRPLGDTPLGRIPLEPGRHDVVLTHPHFEPFRRRVMIRPGETLRLVVDLDSEGVRRER